MGVELGTLQNSQLGSWRGLRAVLDRISTLPGELLIEVRTTGSQNEARGVSGFVRPRGRT